MKIIGMLLVLAASSGMGFLFSKMSSERINDLKEWHKGLVLIKNEIGYALTPMADAFFLAQKKTEGSISHFFGEIGNLFINTSIPLGQISDSLIIGQLKISCLNEGDMESAALFIKEIGAKDKESQISQLELMIKSVEEVIDEAKEKNEKNGKLFKTLGILAGVFVIVIFI